MSLGGLVGPFSLHFYNHGGFLLQPEGSILASSSRGLKTPPG